jgi:hypothetical protein
LFLPALFAQFCFCQLWRKLKGWSAALRKAPTRETARRDQLEPWSAALLARVSARLMAHWALGPAITGIAVIGVMGIATVIDHLAIDKRLLIA